MGYYKSSRLKLETPEAGNSPTITGDLKKLAEQLDELITNPLLLKEQATNVTAASGELVKATASITVTSPTAAANAVFGVLANNHTVNIKAASGKIYGDGIEGATEVTFGEYRGIVLQSDGTNWYIVSGPLIGQWQSITPNESIVSGHIEGRLEGSVLRVRGEVTASAKIKSSYVLFELPTALGEVLGTAAFRVTVLPGYTKGGTTGPLRIREKKVTWEGPELAEGSVIYFAGTVATR